MAGLNFNLVIVNFKQILLGTQGQLSDVPQAAGGSQLELLVGGTDALQQEGNHAALKLNKELINMTTLIYKYN